MTLLIKNTEYFEWEVQDELIALMEKNGLSYQDLIDEYFDVDNIAVAEGADPYYEYAELMDE